jgi:hypothetical protein
MPLSLLGNGLLNTFSRQRGIVGGVAFYAISVVSEESRRLVLPRISHLIVVVRNTDASVTDQALSLSGRHVLTVLRHLNEGLPLICTPLHPFNRSSAAGQPTIWILCDLKKSH